MQPIPDYEILSNILMMSKKIYILSIFYQWKRSGTGQIKNYPLKISSLFLLILNIILTMKYINIHYSSLFQLGY